MTNEQMKELFLALYEAETAEAIHEIVESHPLLSKAENWTPYGGNQNNYSTFENQQSDPIAALVEKITNSIDAVLTKQAWMHGIHPKKGENRPANMEEAVERFFSVPHANWSDLPAKRRREVATDVQVLLTGEAKTPNVTIYDKGEGQHPFAFRDTFLSIQQGNKMSIPFVQGKYNMGSTGSVVFCGGQRYQLIASRRSNELLEEGEEALFGFTLVRLHPLTLDEQRTSRANWYEYCTIEGEIPQFKSEAMDLGLQDTSYEEGSIVKLYSYKLPPGSRSNATLDLWRDLNLAMYKPAIPLLVVERRPAYKGNTLHKIMMGNKARIQVDEGNKLEGTYSVQLKRDFGELPIDVHVFSDQVGEGKKKSTAKIKESVKKEFIKEKAVIFTMNGQVQGVLPRSFISQQLGLNMLRDYMVVHVDCSKLHMPFSREIFMASRDRLKESEETASLKKAMVEALKHHPELLDINERRKHSLMGNSEDDDSLLESVMTNIPVDDDLLKLLSRNSDLSFLRGNSVNSTSKKGYGEGGTGTPSLPKRRLFAPQWFPQVLFAKNEKQELPINQTVTFRFETDAMDDYLSRLKEPGKIAFRFLQETQGDVETYFNIRIEGPKKGIIRVILEPKETVNVGDRYFFRLLLDSQPSVITDACQVTIIAAIEKEKKEKKPKKGEAKPQHPSVPKPIKVYQEGWDAYGWDEDDIVKLVVKNDSSDAYLEGICINMDAAVLHEFIKKKKLKTEAQLKIAKDKFFLHVYLHSMFLYGTMEKTIQKEGLTQEVDEMIANMLKPYSAFLLSLNTNDAVLEHAQ